MTDRLGNRIRALLAAEPSIREVSMFGGLSFMRRDKMLVNVRRSGELLVRADPDRAPDLVTDHGARPAEMGAARRPMAAGWLQVAPELIATDDQLRFWIDVAREFNEQAADGTVRRSRSHPRRR
ncbi:TfoX/Sxy family protein [Pseudonocardia sp. CA-107938]|uniref:TfoX/Sxy family protein n=1 Tax=Pseudonocardia sp. CA-107938 TaxID=3240021 RepID=UPI003D8B0767